MFDDISTQINHPLPTQVLEEAVLTASRWGLVVAHQHIVVMERIHEYFAVKIVAVDELGLGIKQPLLGGVGGVGAGVWCGAYMPGIYDIGIHDAHSHGFRQPRSEVP
jgi:hypothetical protein